MTRDPYRIAGPAVISFSGGRISGYMLRRILDAHGGALPSDVAVVFANTGKERPETLDFVAQCGARWNVRIVWVEYDWDAPHRTRLVSHNSASRNGEPFEALIDRKGFVPNPRMRFCTSFFDLLRDKAAVNAMLRHIGGKRVADANVTNDQGPEEDHTGLHCGRWPEEGRRLAAPLHGVPVQGLHQGRWRTVERQYSPYQVADFLKPAERRSGPLIRLGGP